MSDPSDATAPDDRPSRVPPMTARSPRPPPADRAPRRSGTLAVLKAQCTGPQGRDSSRPVPNPDVPGWERRDRLRPDKASQPRHASRGGFRHPARRHAPENRRPGSDDESPATRHGMQASAGATAEGRTGVAAVVRTTAVRAGETLPQVAIGTPPGPTDRHPRDVSALPKRGNRSPRRVPRDNAWWPSCPSRRGRGIVPPWTSNASRSRRVTRHRP